MGWGGYRNEPAVRLADFGRPDHRLVVRPAEMGRPRPPRRIFGRKFGRHHRPVVRPADSAGRTTGRRFSWPNRPVGPPPGGVGQIFGQNPRRWSWPAKPPPSFSAEDHRRASPPFHSDELPNSTLGEMGVLILRCLWRAIQVITLEQRQHSGTNTLAFFM